MALPDPFALAEARAAFPVLDRVAFLNAGTFGPLARATVDAIAAATAAEADEGRGGDAYFSGLLGLRARVRQGIARLAGVEAGRVALAYSTTSACQIVLVGLGLTARDEVVTTDEEHFGLLGPLHASGARVRLAPTLGRTPAEAVDAVLDAVGPRTRLLALSHVSWLTGNVLPVAELRRATDLPMLVDGAQAVGAVPVDASPYDFYSVSGQKWLCGPDATGAVVVADPESIAVALPTHWGRSSHEQDGSFTPVEGATRFDAGAVPGPSLAGLAAALEGAPDWRFDAARAVAERCRSLLAERYEVVTAPDQATLVTFRPPGEPEVAVSSLRAAGVVVRALPGTPWIRVSCGYWTSDGDLERLLAALD